MTDSTVAALATPAVATPRSIPGLVSIITPTYNRSRFLKKTLTYFRSQDYENIEWLILDDSSQQTESIGELADGRISYERVGSKLTIGEKRNILIEKSKGETIVQFDDDDYYSPTYVSHMVAALAGRGADLINLRGWFLHDLRSSFFGYWDLMIKEGLHYCCDTTGVTPVMLNSQNNRGLANNHLGYGFSYAFKRRVWEAVKFPHIDWNEDGEFTQSARSRFRVNGIHDTAGLCLHYLHRASTSRCFPQHRLPRFLLTRLFPALGEMSPPQ